MARDRILGLHMILAGFHIKHAIDSIGGVLIGVGDAGLDQGDRVQFLTLAALIWVSGE